MFKLLLFFIIFNAVESRALVSNETIDWSEINWLENRTLDVEVTQLDVAVAVEVTQFDEAHKPLDEIINVSNTLWVIAGVLGVISFLLLALLVAQTRDNMSKFCRRCEIPLLKRRKRKPVIFHEIFIGTPAQIKKSSVHF